MVAAPHVWLRHPPGPPGFEAMVDRMARRLDTTDAAKFRAAMAAERGTYDTGRTQIDAARHALAGRLVEEPFDAVAARAALDVMQSRIHDTTTRFNDALARAVGNMSPGGRREVASFLEGGPR